MIIKRARRVSELANPQIELVVCMDVSCIRDIDNIRLGHDWWEDKKNEDETEDIGKIVGGRCSLC